MDQVVLVINAGSSSIKYRVGTDVRGDITFAKRDGMEYATGFTYKNDTTGGKHKQLWTQAQGVSREQALKDVLIFLRVQDVQFAAAGHRVVHGGNIFSAPTLIDANVIRVIEELCAIAPLHNPVALAPIRTILTMYPDLPQVAVFDTAFHRTIPTINKTYALPQEFADIERFGFHGSSYEYIARKLPEYVLTPQLYDMVIVAHIGSGASMCLIGWNGRSWESLACTLGWGTSGNGPLHATRAVLDADATLEVVQRVKGRGKAALITNARAVILKQGGLLGLSGHSDDMRDIVAATKNAWHPQHQACIAARESYTERGIETFGIYAAKAHAHGRLRAVVWTAGVGEHDASFRAETARAIPGLRIHKGLNEQTCPVGRISTKKCKILGLVIPTDEEGLILQHVADVLGDTKARIPA